MSIEKINELATSLADELDTDILVYSGEIERPFDTKIIDACRNARRRKNVMFILCTYGGDPSAGYRIARCLQQQYEKFIILIGGSCKSAGTLITVGAHEIVMSDHGEIGPLDVQIGKKDELWETDSGLTVLSAIEALETKSFDLFESCFLNLKGRSGGRITLKTATEMASKLAIGIITPIVAQIDPMHVGEVSRAMNIGLEYGNRLNNVSKNSYEDTLQKLVNSYPLHGFVIDREEAKELFQSVRAPTDRENQLLDLLGPLARNQRHDTIFTYLSEAPKEPQHESNNQGDNQEGNEAGGETIAGSEIADSEAEPRGTRESGSQSDKLRQILSGRKASS